MTSIFFCLNTNQDVYLVSQIDNILNKNNISHNIDYFDFDLNRNWPGEPKHARFFQILDNVFSKKDLLFNVKFNDDNHKNHFLKMMAVIDSLPKYDIFCISLWDKYIDVYLLAALRYKRKYPLSKILFGGPEIVLRPFIGDILKKLRFDYSTGDADVSVLNFITKNSEFYNTRHISKMNLLIKDDVPKYCDEDLRLTSGNIIVSSSRGCPHNCYFCSSPALCSYSFVERDVLVDWFKYYNDIGVANCFPNDSTFNFGKFDVLLDGLISINNKVNIHGIDISLRDTKIEQIQKMKEAKINSVAIGLECLHPTLQKNINKKMPSVEQILKLLDEYKRNDIEVKMFYIAGMPTQTDEIFYQEAEVIEHIDKTYDNVLFEYYNYFVSPQSYIYKNPEKFNIDLYAPYEWFGKKYPMFKNEIDQFVKGGNYSNVDSWMRYLYNGTTNKVETTIEKKFIKK